MTQYNKNIGRAKINVQIFLFQSPSPSSSYTTLSGTSDSSDLSAIMSPLEVEGDEDDLEKTTLSNVSFDVSTSSRGSRKLSQDDEPCKKYPRNKKMTRKENKTQKEGAIQKLREENEADQAILRDLVSASNRMATAAEQIAKTIAKLASNEENKEKI